MLSPWARHRDAARSPVHVRPSERQVFRWTPQAAVSAQGEQQPPLGIPGRRQEPSGLPHGSRSSLACGSPSSDLPFGPVSHEFKHATWSHSEGAGQLRHGTRAGHTAQRVRPSRVPQDPRTPALGGGQVNLCSDPPAAYGRASMCTDFGSLIVGWNRVTSGT